MNLKRVLDRIRKCMESEDRKDVEFRMVLAMTEVGDVAKYITHDSTLNPGARTHGTPKDEALAYGQAFSMLFAACQLRGVDIEEAIELGLKNWEDADWRRRSAKAAAANKLVGISIFPGVISGEVYMLNEEHPADKIPQGAILVAPFAKPYLKEFMPRMSALITDDGGATSHAGVMATEQGLICLLGTGNATKLLKHREMVSISIPVAGHGVECTIERRLGSADRRR